MRRAIEAVLTVLAMTSMAPAQTGIPAGELPGLRAIRQSDLRRDLTYISSDELGGRMTLQPGDELATRWIARQFAQAGLEPAVQDETGLRSYLQPIRVIEYQPDRAASSLTLTRSGVQKVWQAPEAFGTFPHAVRLTAPLVFAGFGITAPELGYDDYAGIDVRGRIVLVFDHEPQENDANSVFNGSANTRYATTRVKVMNAQRHGAVAVIIVAEPNRTHPTNEERYARIGGSARLVPIPYQALAEDEVRIPSVVVLDDVARELFRTTGMSPSDAQAAIDRDLKPQTRLLPDTVLTLSLRNISERTGITNNVAGLLRGSDPQLAAETILITAHHDHNGMSPCLDPAHPPASTPPDPHPCPQIWHGADDNGSGTVGVVELARAFAANRARPKRSILFVVFAGEERGYLGSYWMAAHPLRPLATTRAQINFDMIGRDEAPSPQTDGLIRIPADTTNRLNLIGAPYSPDYLRTVEEQNKSIGLVLDDRFDHDAVLNVFFRSDQFPFVLHDIPAFWWFTGFHPDYHHTTDTVDKIDFPKMERILQLAYLTAWRFGTEAVPPRFVANPRGATKAGS